MKSPHTIRSELFDVYEENLSRNEIKDDIEDVSLFGGRYTEPIVVCPVGELIFMNTDSIYCSFVVNSDTADDLKQFFT